MSRHSNKGTHFKGVFCKTQIGVLLSESVHGLEITNLVVILC